MATKVIKYVDLYGYEDVIHVINNDEGYEDGWYLKEIEMDYGDGKKLADALIKQGVEVKYDEDSDTWEAKDSHWDDCYWYPYTNDESLGKTIVLTPPAKITTKGGDELEITLGDIEIKDLNK